MTCAIDLPGIVGQQKMVSLVQEVISQGNEIRQKEC